MRTCAPLFHRRCLGLVAVEFPKYDLATVLPPANVSAWLFGLVERQPVLRSVRRAKWLLYYAATGYEAEQKVHPMPGIPTPDAEEGARQSALSFASGEAEVAQRARARIAWRLLPFLFLLYIIAFLDRMNVGAAALQMLGDLGFNDRVMGLGAGVFFIGYLVL